MNIDWNTVLRNLKLTGLAGALVDNCMLKSYNDSTIHLLVNTAQAPLLLDKVKERIKHALSQFLGYSVKLVITITDKEIDTPLKQKLHKLQELEALQYHKKAMIDMDRVIEKMSHEERDKLLNSPVDVSAEKILMEYLCKKSEKLENGKWYRLSCDFSANTDINEIMLSNLFGGVGVK